LQNELIEEDTRQEARLCRAFSFAVCAVWSCSPVFLLAAILPHLKHGRQTPRAAAIIFMHVANLMRFQLQPPLPTARVTLHWRAKKCAHV
jgi:hypothetical protein